MKNNVSLKNCLKNLYMIFFRNCKASIILNYHRIGNIDPENPFHRLHTVRFSIFKIQIKICNILGKFVSLRDLNNSNLQSKLNFSITFDDVSNSIEEALNWLNDNNIPFAIAPCQLITEDNCGWRDKVYFIEKFINKKDISDLLFKVYKKKFKEGFYGLSKSSNFDQEKMINEIVNPLYKKISNENKKKFSEKYYFSRTDLISLKNKFPNMEILNHSFSHVDLTDLSINKINNEIEKCSNFISKELGILPEFFAVPFGKFNTFCSIGLCESSRKQNIKAIFWVSNQINLDIGCKPNKIKQFCRFHTPTTILGFCKSLILSFFRTDFLQNLNKETSVESKSISILKNPNNDKIIAFEDLSRPIKDYTGSEKFLKNFYQDNPFLGSKNHTLAEIQNERIISIGHNLFLPFEIGNEQKTVNFWGNWRSLSGSSSSASALLLVSAIKEAEITAVYKPSRFAAPTFKKLNWHEIVSKAYFLDIKNLINTSYSSSFHVFNKLFDFSDFVKLNKSQNDLRINLSNELLNWRVENYELAKPIYFILDKSKKEKAFLIAQYGFQKLLVLDQRFSSSDALQEILEQIKLWCFQNKINQIILESSCLQTIQILDFNYPNNKSNVSSSFFYFKDKHLKLKNKSIVISPLSTDVFLRN